MKNKLIVSPSPHIHSGDSIEKNMYGVLIALVPAFIVSLYVFGIDAFIITLASVVFCIITEYVVQRFMFKKEPTIFDGSAIITGVLLAFNVPSNLPIWIVAIGAIVAIGVGKMSFGGLGKNIFNPALLGAFLLLKRIISWHIPVSIMLTVAVFAGGMYLIDPVALHNPLIHLFSGGLMLGAIFMATDYATSPLSHKGMLIYAVGIGVITMCIRLWGSYPEGVSFAILLMNAFTPLINNYVKPKRFGEVVKNG